MNYEMWRWKYWQEHKNVSYAQIEKAVKMGLLAPGQSVEENRVNPEDLVTKEPVRLWMVGWDTPDAHFTEHPGGQPAVCYIREDVFDKMVKMAEEKLESTLVGFADLLNAK
jgi:hypothetical protein